MACHPEALTKQVLPVSAMNAQKTRVTLSGVPSWAEEAGGTSGGWRTGEPAGRNAVEGSRRFHAIRIVDARGLSTALRPSFRLRSAQDDTRFWVFMADAGKEPVLREPRNDRAFQTEPLPKHALAW